MIQRKLMVLVLGELPEIGDIFERQTFTETYPTEVERIRARDRFDEALSRESHYNLILLDLSPHGLEVLERVRDHWPATPVVMIADLDETDLLLEAERKGLQDYVLRVPDGEVVTELLAEKIESQWRRFVEPPSMDRPGAGEVYRYAQFYNVLQPFVLVSEKRRLLYVNRAAQRLIENLHGYSPVVGDPVGEWWLDTSVEQFEQRLSRAFGGHQVVSRRDLSGDSGGEHLHELYYQPVVDPSGRVVAVSIAVHEAARPELQRARTRQAVTEFAGGVAHQNNNLLNILSANIELLEEQCEAHDDREALRHLERMRRSTNRAAEFTHQLQTYSKTAVTRREALSLNELLEQMREALAECTGDGIAFELVLADEVPPIRGDRQQFETMVRYLVDNAAEAIDGEGRVECRTAPRRVSYREAGVPVAEGDYVVLEVADDGEGIPEEVRDRIFEPFFTTRRASQHVGLGLAIVETIVEESGGGISFETEVGEGTTFRVYFPIDREWNDPKGSTVQETTAFDTDVGTPTILLVEDEPDLRSSFRELLELEGYEVLTAADLHETEQMLDERVGGEASFDLIITDVELPDGRAPDLVEEVNERSIEVPFIFISGYGESVREELQHAGRRECVFLAKPLQIDTLLGAVGDVLQLR